MKSFRLVVTAMVIFIITATAYSAEELVKNPTEEMLIGKWVGTLQTDRSGKNSRDSIIARFERSKSTGKLTLTTQRKTYDNVQITGSYISAANIYREIHYQMYKNGKGRLILKGEFRRNGLDKISHMSSGGTQELIKKKEQKN